MCRINVLFIRLQNIYMATNTCGLSVETLDTKYLSDEDLMIINNVTQDMWAGKS